MSSVRCFISGLDWVGEEGHTCFQCHTAGSSRIIKPLSILLFCINLFIPSFFNFIIMPRTCVAGCSSAAWPEATGIVSFHRFPDKTREPDRYAAWVKQVQRTRMKWNGPTARESYICNRHFKEEDFEVGPRLMENLGISSAKKNVLKKGRPGLGKLVRNLATGRPEFWLLSLL